MPTIDFVQGQIQRLEGFNVRIRYEDGRNVRDDRAKHIEGYNIHSNRAADTMTVADWKRRRFHQKYPGFDCDVLYPDGNVAAGNTLLRTVRASY